MAASHQGPTNEFKINQAYSDFIRDFSSIKNYMQRISKNDDARRLLFGFSLIYLKKIVDKNPFTTVELSEEAAKEYATYLAWHWKMVKNTDFSYCHKPDEPFNQTLIKLAKAIAPILKKNPYELLMPDVDWDAKNVEFKSAREFADDPHFNLKHYVLSDETKDRPARLIHVLDSLPVPEGDGEFHKTMIFSNEDKNLPQEETLSDAEKGRVINHLAETKAYFRSITNLTQLRRGELSPGERHNFLTFLNRLSERLKAGGVHARDKKKGELRNATEYVAGKAAGEGIREFKLFLDSITPEERQQLYELKGTDYNFKELWLRILVAAAYSDPPYITIDHEELLSHVAELQAVGAAADVENSSLLPRDLPCVELFKPSLDEIIRRNKNNPFLFSQHQGISHHQDDEKKGVTAASLMMLENQEKEAYELVKYALNESNFMVESSYGKEGWDRFWLQVVNGAKELGNLVSGNSNLKDTILAFRNDLGITDDASLKKFYEEIFKTAIDFGNKELIRICINELGCDRLHKVTNGQLVSMSPLEYAIAQYKLDVALLLVQEAKVDVNLPFSTGKPALHQLIYMDSYRYEDIRKFILESKSSVTVRDAEGNTILHTLLKASYSLDFRPDDDIEYFIEFLIENGLTGLESNTEGITVRDLISTNYSDYWAKRFQDCFTALDLWKSVKELPVSQWHTLTTLPPSFTPKQRKLLIPKMTSRHGTWNDIFELFYPRPKNAWEERTTENINEFLSLVSPSYLSEAKQAIMYRLAKRDSKHDSGGHDFKKFVEKEWKNLDLTAADHEGNTVLHLAVQAGEFDRIEWLVNKKGLRNYASRNNNGQTALEYAQTLMSGKPRNWKMDSCISFLAGKEFEEKLLNTRDNQEDKSNPWLQSDEMMNFIKTLDTVEQLGQFLTKLSGSEIHANISWEKLMSYLNESELYYNLFTYKLNYLLSDKPFSELIKYIPEKFRIAFKEFVIKNIPQKSPVPLDELQKINASENLKFQVTDPLFKNLISSEPRGSESRLETQCHLLIFYLNLLQPCSSDTLERVLNENMCPRWYSDDPTQFNIWLANLPERFQMPVWMVLLNKEINIGGYSRVRPNQECFDRLSHYIIKLNQLLDEDKRQDSEINKDKQRIGIMVLKYALQNVIPVFFLSQFCKTHNLDLSGRDQEGNNAYHLVANAGRLDIANWLCNECKLMDQRNECNNTKHKPHELEAKPNMQGIHFDDLTAILNNQVEAFRNTSPQVSLSPYIKLVTSHALRNIRYDESNNHRDENDEKRIMSVKKAENQLFLLAKYFSKLGKKQDYLKIFPPSVKIEGLKPFSNQDEEEFKTIEKELDSIYNKIKDHPEGDKAKNLRVFREVILDTMRNNIIIHLPKQIAESWKPSF